MTSTFVVVVVGWFAFASLVGDPDLRCLPGLGLHLQCYDGVPGATVPPPSTP